MRLRRFETAGYGRGGSNLSTDIALER